MSSQRLGNVDLGTLRVEGFSFSRSVVDWRFHCCVSQCSDHQNVAFSNSHPETGLDSDVDFYFRVTLCWSVVTW